MRVARIFLVLGLIVGLALLITTVLLCPVVAVSASAADKAEIEKWGEITDISSGARTEVFAVRLGSPEKLVLQSPLATMIGRYGANADLYIRRDTEWIRISWREPREDEVSTGNLSDLQSEERVVPDMMPEWYRRLAVNLRETVRAFFHFRSGNAFVILLQGDQSEAAARRLASAINADWF